MHACLIAALTKAHVAAWSLLLIALPCPFATFCRLPCLQIEGPSGSTPVDQVSAYNSSATATTASSDLTIGYMKQPSTIAERIKLVNELPGYAPLSEKYSSLRRVLALRVPLTACRPVGNETEVILALNVTSKTPDDTGTTYQFFWSPFTQLGTANGLWPEDGVQVTSHATMMCAGASACLAPGDPRPVSKALNTTRLWTRQYTFLKPEWFESCGLAMLERNVC